MNKTILLELFPFTGTSVAQRNKTRKGLNGIRMSHSEVLEQKAYSRFSCCSFFTLGFCILSWKNQAACFIRMKYLRKNCFFGGGGASLVEKFPPPAKP